jgi:hypothetical protein
MQTQRKRNANATQPNPTQPNPTQPNANQRNATKKNRLKTKKNRTANQRLTSWKRLAAFLIYKRAELVLSQSLQSDSPMTALVVKVTMMNEVGKLKSIIQPGENGVYDTVAQIAKGVRLNLCPPFVAWLSDKAVSPYGFHNQMAKMQPRAKRSKADASSANPAADEQ